MVGSLCFFVGGESLTKRRQKEILDENTMRRAINRISFEIMEKNSGGRDLILAGIRTRGEFIARRIAKKIYEVEGVEPEVYDLDISAFRDDIPLQDRKKIPLPKIPEIEKKTVILVDDVLYTGRTVRAAIELISQIGRAKKIQLAVLVDRGHREVPIRPDYIGKNLPTAEEETVKVLMKEIDGNDTVFIFRAEEKL